MLIVGAPEAAQRLLRLAGSSSRRMIRPPSGIFSGSTLLRSTMAPGTVWSSAFIASSTCSASLAGMASLRPQLLVDQRWQLRRPVLGRVGDVEPLRQLHLRHQQEHHDRGQTLSAPPGAIGCAPEASQPGGPARGGEKLS
jgi:hypothetical protein